MRDRAVGLAVAHRRTVRPARRVHQDHVLAVEREPLEDAGRSVAFHARAPRLGVSGFLKERTQLRHALDAGRERAVADHAGVAHLGTKLRRQREGDVEAVRRQQARRAVRPFQQHDAALRQIVEAELGKFRTAGEPVEIGMHQQKARQLVILHQREGRARHLDRVVAGEVTDQRPRERGLAGAEIAGQRHQIAAVQQSGYLSCEARGIGFAAQRYRKARAGGGGRKHRGAPICSMRCRRLPGRSVQPCIATTTQQIAQNRQYSKPPICHSHLPALWRHIAQAATSRNTASTSAT